MGTIIVYIIVYYHVNILFSNIIMIYFNKEPLRSFFICWLRHVSPIAAVGAWKCNFSAFQGNYDWPNNQTSCRRTWGFMGKEHKKSPTCLFIFFLAPYLLPLCDTDNNECAATTYLGELRILVMLSELGLVVIWMSAGWKVERVASTAATTFPLLLILLAASSLQFSTALAAGFG